MRHTTENPSGKDKQKAIKDKQKAIIDQYMSNAELSFNDGYSNTAVLATRKDCGLVFRFPKDPRALDTFKKEEYYCRFLRDQVSVKLPDLRVGEHDGVLFTVHRLIPGKTLYERMRYGISQDELLRATRGIASFVNDMRKISAYKVASSHMVRFSEQVAKLYTEAERPVDAGVIRMLETLEEGVHLHPIHGDLSAKNIIVDEKCDVAGIVDLGAVSVSSYLIDLAKIAGYYRDTYSPEMLVKEFAVLSGKTVSLEHLEKIRQIRLHGEREIAEGLVLKRDREENQGNQEKRKPFLFGLANLGGGRG